jgi:hypothetical protein
LKMYHLATPEIYQHLPLQYPPKFTKFLYFWYENIPSGNP